MVRELKMHISQREAVPVVVHGRFGLEQLQWDVNFPVCATVLLMVVYFDFGTVVSN